jgi:DNA sulfur modification protein DndC
LGLQQLISLEKLSEIRRIWREEKHEFDDALPRIYHEVTEEEFQDPRPGANSSILGRDEWELLAEICDDPMQLELMTRLLDTERQFKTLSRRHGIYEALEKCFEVSSRSAQDAVNNAYRNRDLRSAAQEGDIKKVNTLQNEESKEAFASEWANMKFGRRFQKTQSQNDA